MSATAVLITGLTLAVLAICSLRAARRLAHLPRLAMQWGFDGRPTWTAPRWLALSFTPALAAILMTASAFLLPPGRPGEADVQLAALVILAVSFVGAHLYHLRRLGKSAV